MSAVMPHGELALRHKIRMLIAFGLIVLSLGDLMSSLVGFPSVLDWFSDLVLLLTAIGLLGTAVYLAEEATTFA
jgi:hypothetical protein